MRRSTLINDISRKLRNLFVGAALLTAVAAPVAETQAHSVQVAYCANCASTLRIFFEHWHGCTVNPATSGTITISMTIGATTTTTTGFPTLNLCNVPFSALPGCNLPPVFVASCPASANVYQDWWAFDFNNVPCGVPISIVASNPSNVYVADCGGMFPVSFSLTIPCNVNKPFANFSVSADTVCLGQAISFTDLSTGGNPGLTYQWDFNDGSPLSTAQNPTHTYAAPGTYCVRLDVAKQSGGCLDDTTICVTVLANPIINIGNPTICAGQTASLTANAAPGGGTYNWTPGGMTTQTINVSPAATTTYTVNYVSPGGCAGSQTATVTVNPNPTVNVSNATICAGQSGTITATPSIGGGTYAWTPGGMTTQSITAGPGATTTYTVTYTDPNGCTATGTGTITVNPNPTVNVNNATMCVGAGATLTATPSIGGGTYAWTPGGMTTQTINVNPGTTTTYTVTYTDPNGCTGTGSGTVTVNPNPTVAVNNATICAGQNATLTATPNPGGGTYAWAPGGATTATITVSPGATTTYTVTYTDLNGCTATASGTVTVNPNPTVNVTNATICAGQSGTITATPSIGGGTYAWTPGGMTTQSITLSPGATTTYTVTYTDPNGCVGIGTGTITVNPNPTVAVNNATMCAGAGASLTATPSIGGGTYAWTPGGMTTQTINVNPGATTTYTVTYTDPNGCTGTGSGTVTVNPNPTVNVTGSTTICGGQSATLTATPNPGGGTYSWAPGGATTATITVSPGATTTYTVTYTDLNGCTATGTGTITVNPQPTITLLPASICAGQSTTLTPTVNPGGGTYLWTPGGATTASITVSPATTTSYKVVYTLNGCIDSATTTVTVTTNPTVNVLNDTICLGQTGSLTALPSVGGGTYLWAPGGMTSQTITATPGATTTYTVTYNMSGCTGTGSGSIVVNPQPTVAATNATICAGQNATITATPSIGGGTYSWTPGGMTTQSITVSPGATTTYTVTYDLNGCQATATGTVTVNPQPTVSVNNASICAGQTTTLTANATPVGVTYLWAPGGATTASINVSPAATTTYLVTVTAPGGCTDTASGTVTVITNPTANFNAANVCDGVAMQFNNTSVPTTAGWAWNFGDGNTSTQQNPTHTYAGPGTYNVKLVMTAGSGCMDSVTIPVTVDPLPVPAFNTTPACPGFGTQFTDGTTVGTGTVTGWSWDFGDGNSSTQQNPAHAYAAGGTYTVKLIATSSTGCVDSITQTITVPYKPIAQFTHDTVCLGQPTSFTDQSTVTNGTITGWNWAFGDGNTSTQQNPQNTYATAGTFTTTLIVTSNDGCLDTITSVVTVIANPVAAFTAPNVCDGYAMLFTNTSAPSTANWSWDFGDGNTSTQQNPSHTYAGPGTYNVKLVMTAGTGCSDSVTIPVTIDPLPVPAFTTAPACPGFGTQFTDGSTVGTGTITGWSWDFGDGNSSTQQNPAHPYAAGGTYTVKLIATSSAGCVDSITQTITVPYKPIAQFTHDTVCLGVPTSFTDQSAVTGGTITGWNWAFGDGNTSTQQNPQNTYATAGTFTTTLIVTSNDGCLDTVTSVVTVIANPVASFTAPGVCDLLAMQFTDGSTPAPSQWSWNFGDGNTSTQQNPSHTYAGPGTYNVKLVITAGSGCMDSITQPVTIYPLPQPNFTFTDDCANQAINFTNTSTIPAGNINGWLWKFGNGATSTQQNPTYTYTAPGAYTVTLIATSDNGCIDSIQQVINIFALPVTDFTFDTVCLNDQTCFLDLTTVQGSNITGWQWVFGDGSPVNNQSNPCHTYAAPGTFNVTLITTSAQGCTGTATHTILVNDNPTANFSVNNVCQIDAAMFNDLSTIGAGVISNWQWNFGDGSPQSNQQNPSHNYGIPGTYTVQLVAFAGTGCSDTIVQDVVIHPMPTANFNFTNVCDGLQLPLIDNSNVSAGAITGWNWSFGDGSPNGTNQNENHIYPNFGSWNVQLIVTTDSGCTDTISKTVDVYPGPLVDFGPTSVCEGTPTQFNDLSTVPNNGSAQSWIWNFGDGSPNAAGATPTHTYPQWGTYQTKLIVTTNNGCIDSLTKPVNVNAVPVSEFVADVLDGCEPVCPNFTNQATIANGGIVSYVWDFGDGNGSTQMNPSHCYPNSGTSVLTYNVTLTVTSDSGCVHAITKPAYISVYPYPVADFNPDPDVVKISAPDITFNNYSVGNAQNSWDFGDGVGTSTGVSPTYTYQDTGNFIVWLYIENQWGCRDSTWRQVRVDPEFFIYIPNAFTPGEDGINDKWNAVVYGVDEMSTLIFNRWGELIWEGHQLDSKWDGMVKGNKAETETYVYLIKLVTFSGENKEYRGKVTLLK